MEFGTLLSPLLKFKHIIHTMTFYKDYKCGWEFLLQLLLVKSRWYVSHGAYLIFYSSFFFLPFSLSLCLLLIQILSTIALTSEALHVYIHMLWLVWAIRCGLFCPYNTNSSNKCSCLFQWKLARATIKVFSLYFMTNKNKIIKNICGRLSSLDVLQLTLIICIGICSADMWISKNLTF